MFQMDIILCVNNYYVKILILDTINKILANTDSTNTRSNNIDRKKYEISKKMFGQTYATLQLLDL